GTGTNGALNVSGTGSVTAGQDLTDNGTMTVSTGGTVTVTRDFLGTPSTSTNLSGGTLKIGRDFRLPTAGISNWNLIPNAGTVEFTTASAGDGGQFTGLSPGGGSVQFNNLTLSGSNDPNWDNVANTTIQVKGNYANNNTLATAPVLTGTTTTFT